MGKLGGVDARQLPGYGAQAWGGRWFERSRDKRQTQSCGLNSSTSEFFFLPEIV